jgi:hypothetical protein
VVLTDPLAVDTVMSDPVRPVVAGDEAVWLRWVVAVTPASFRVVAAPTP